MARTRPATRKNQDSEGSDSEESVHEEKNPKKPRLHVSDVKQVDPEEQALQTGPEENKPPADKCSGSTDDKNREPSVQTEPDENKPPADDDSKSPDKKKSGGGSGSPQNQASADDMKPAQGPEDADPVEMEEVAETPDDQASQLV